MEEADTIGKLILKSFLPHPLSETLPFGYKLRWCTSTARTGSIRIGFWGVYGLYITMCWGFLPLVIHDVSSGNFRTISDASSSLSTSFTGTNRLSFRPKKPVPLSRRPIRSRQTYMGIDIETKIVGVLWSLTLGQFILIFYLSRFSRLVRFMLVTITWEDSTSFGSIEMPTKHWKEE